MQGADDGCGRRQERDFLSALRLLDLHTSHAIERG